MTADTHRGNKPGDYFERYLFTKSTRMPNTHAGIVFFDTFRFLYFGLFERRQLNFNGHTAFHRRACG